MGSGQDMARPQQPELARSGKTDLDPDRVGTELESRKPVRSSRQVGPVPPENQPGHRPDQDQDKPDPDAFVAKLQGEDRPDPANPQRAEHRLDLETSTKEDLYQRARELGVKGRSKMDKAELAEAISRRLK
jgi:Rho termination factor, N-terminal domain